MLTKKIIKPIKNNTRKEEKKFKYLDIITTLFVTILLVSNIVAVKIVKIGIFLVPGATLLFPISYIFGDILTEVYGYGRSRKVIWLGIICNLLMAIIFIIIGALPSAPIWHNQNAYETILGLTPRIVVASILGYFTGEFTNSFTMARMKIITEGKYLWTRTIGSTLIGEFFDTLLFIMIAFTGVIPSSVLLSLIIAQYILKVTIEILFTPITYRVVSFLKRTENEDYYDRDTNFNPFILHANKNIL